MTASPEQRPVDVRKIRDTRQELDHLLKRLDSTLSALRVEIDNVQRIIDDRKT